MITEIFNETVPCTDDYKNFERMKHYTTAGQDLPQTRQWVIRFEKYEDLLNDEEQESRAQTKTANNKHTSYML